MYTVANKLFTFNQSIFYLPIKICFYS